MEELINKLKEFKAADDSAKKMEETIKEAIVYLERMSKYEEECRKNKSFFRRIRKDEKHDIDLFNQGQEYKCNQFLNLLVGEPNWTYEGKYFNETDRQIENMKKEEICQKKKRKQ